MNQHMTDGARSKIPAFIKEHPGLSLLATSMVLGVGLIAPAATGILPAGFVQLGAMSASVAAVLLVAVEGGRRGVRELLGRGLIWRVGISWWGFALFSTAVVSVITLGLLELHDGVTVGWGELRSPHTILPAIVILTVLAGLGEEFGWRGFLLPRLQRRHSPLRSSVIVGGLHTLWHVPLFFVAGTMQHAWAQEIGLLAAVVGYGVFLTAWAIQFTWLFNNTRGSVLLAAVLHGAGNAWIGGYFDIHGQAGFGGNLVLTGVIAVLSITIVCGSGLRTISGERVEGLAGKPGP